MIEGSGARRRIRTTDTRIFNPLLYQLSYPGIAKAIGSAPMANRLALGKGAYALSASSSMAGGPASA